MRVAVYAGSFDPPTLGHMDIIRRAGEQFDNVVILVACNPAKKTGMFNQMERMNLLYSLLMEELGDAGTHLIWRHSNDPILESEPKYMIRAIGEDVATVNVAREMGAHTVIRGLRSMMDFEKEFGMALVNRKLAPTVDTVFLMTAHEHMFTSSSTAKEVAFLKGDLTSFVHPWVAQQMMQKLEAARHA